MVTTSVVLVQNAAEPLGSWHTASSAPPAGTSPTTPSTVPGVWRQVCPASALYQRPDPAVKAESATTTSRRLSAHSRSIAVRLPSDLRAAGSGAPSARRPR
jgi:hypothetical protein